MFNFTEVGTAYLKERRESLKIVIRGMYVSRASENDPIFLQNLTNGLFILQNELTDIESELLERGVLTIEQLYDGTVVIVEKTIN